MHFGHESVYTVLSLCAVFVVASHKMIWLKGLNDVDSGLVIIFLKYWDHDQKHNEEKVGWRFCKA